jgi:hypothetical protein
MLLWINIKCDPQETSTFLKDKFVCGDEREIYSNRVKSYFYNLIPIVSCVNESVTIFYFDLAVSPNGFCCDHDYDLRSVIPE